MEEAFHYSRGPCLNASFAQGDPLAPVDSSVFVFGSVTPFNNTYVFQLRGLIDHLHFVGKNERSAGLIDQIHFSTNLTRWF